MTATALPLRPLTRPLRAPAVRLRTVLGIATGIVLVVALVNVTTPRALGVLIALAALAPWVVARPIRGLQALLVAAIVIEIFPLGFPDSFTDRVPFYEGLNNSMGLAGVSITPAELLMALVLGGALLRSSAETRASLVHGRLFRPYLLFLGAVLLGEVHGLMAGGDLNKSLWELRPQVYGFIAFVAASLLIRSRDDLKALALLAVVAILVKAGMGDVRYFLILNHDLGTHETVLGHEDSYFLALVPMGAIVSAIWGGWTQTTKLLTLGSVVALAALLANERRAGVAAFAAGVIVIVLMAIRFFPLRRRRVLVIGLMVAAAATVFLIAFWSVQTGLIGQLVRPVRSQFDPTNRDYLSDIYRQAENTNLKLSFLTNRLIGMGFGMPFLTVLTQADISNIYPLWNYIPHNTLMWVGVRMGLVGVATFWALFGSALLEVCRSQEVQRDRLVLALTALAGGAIVSELFVAYADLQLESYRNMIFIGIVFGLLNIVPALFGEPATEKRPVA